MSNNSSVAFSLLFSIYNSFIFEPRHMISNNVAFFKIVDSVEPVKPTVMLINSKCCSFGSFLLIEYASDLQRLGSDCAFAQADLRLCWSHIPH